MKSKGMTIGELIERLLVIQKAESPALPVAIRCADGSHFWIECLVTDADLQELVGFGVAQLDAAAVIYGGSYQDHFTRSSSPETSDE